jgi:hypothetical protein
MRALACHQIIPMRAVYVCRTFSAVAIGTFLMAPTTPAAASQN